MEQRRYTPPQEKGMTRRQFLTWMGIGGVAAATGLVAGEVIWRSPLPDQSPYPESNLQAIDARRGIELVNLSPEEVVYLQSSFPGYEITPFAWDDERALMVDQFLLFLPDFFYAPNDRGKVQFSLVGESNAYAHQAVFATQYNLVTLDPELFTMQDMVTSFEVLTHELTHKTTQGRYFQESPDIDQILGGRFDEKRGEYMQRLSTAQLPDLVEMKGFRGFLAYGFSRPYPEEFVAVLSQFYTHGRDIFDEYMSAVFGRKKADDLYVYIGDTIFRGQEYAHFPIVVR